MNKYIEAGYLRRQEEAEELLRAEEAKSKLEEEKKLKKELAKKKKEENTSKTETKGKRSGSRAILQMDDDMQIIRRYESLQDREVFYMSLNGTDVYDKDQGGFLINVNDVHVPESTMTVTQKEELRDLTEKVLDKYFKHAPYYDAWGMARSDDDYMVQCEAYASNDLGVKKYVPARVWYTKSGEEYIVTGVSIDGVQYEVK